MKVDAIRLKITGGRVIDPANRFDAVADVFVADGRVAALGDAPAGFAVEREIDAAGQIVCPGLVDLSARLREPGAEHKATIESETRAAASAGIATLCTPPDTDPVIDTPAVVELIHQRASAAAMARVEVLGALTRGLEGEQLAEMKALADAGCAGMSNATRPVRDTLVMRRAMEYAATFGQTVFLRAEDPWLAQGGYVHQGAVSTRLGLPGIPETAETIAVSRDLLLAEQSGARIHFCQLSSARAVELVRDAQGRGLAVTADAAAHQLFLTEADTADFDSLYHVRPPLRTANDRAGLRAGLADGTLVALCSDHQPHERDAKLNPVADTEPGISALETLLPLMLTLVGEGVIPIADAIARLTCGPARILGLERGTLSPGAAADICIFDPEARWTLTDESLVSRGHNTPFLDSEFLGRATHTVVGGRLAHQSILGRPRGMHPAGDQRGRAAPLPHWKPPSR